MIVPDFWAEARTQHRHGKRQITVRRFGWSNHSLSDAQEMAESRASEALNRILSGEKLDRRERKTAYNGAIGVPIREEVLSRHGEEAITRNGYGAHCLNTPRALFADIDFHSSSNGKTAFFTFGVLLVACASLGFQYQRWSWALGLLFISLFTSGPIATWFRKGLLAIRGGPMHLARQRILGYLEKHPDWNLRIYKTPGGLRLLATHKPFDPRAEEVQQFFSGVGTDPLYVRMCLNQRCFRARLTAKPWRMGIAGHMRPRPGIWPIDASRQYLRDTWVKRYEEHAIGFAACQFVESLGSELVHQDLQSVIELHDHHSKALLTGLPLA